MPNLNPIDIDRADNEDTILWSVTTIIGALDKPAIPYWAAQQTADAAIDDEEVWKALLKSRGHDEASKWLRDARFRPGKTTLASTDLGTVVHKVCEHYALSGRKPGPDYIEDQIAARAGKNTDVEAETKLVATMLDLFDNWAARFQPEYQAAEMTVYHPDYGYAGQLDAILRIDGITFITDYKTSREPLDSQGRPRTPYPEQVGLQLAAYRNAAFAATWRARRFEERRRRYYALSADETALAVPVPSVDTGLVIHITPQACDAFPMRCDAYVFDYFLHTLECFRWVQEDAPDVMGDPLTESGL